MTSATASPGREAEPLKITSVISAPRIEVGRVSPSTQRTLSTTLLLPQPLGPTTPVSEFVPNSKTVRSANDLKPKSSRRRRRMDQDSSRCEVLEYAEGDAAVGARSDCEGASSTFAGASGAGSKSLAPAPGTGSSGAESSE